MVAVAETSHACSRRLEATPVIIAPHVVLYEFSHDNEPRLAFEQQDAAAMAELYTQDGQALPPGVPTATGHNAVATVWQGAMDAGIRRVELVTTEVEGFGDTAHEIGTYTLFGEGEQVMDEGNYVVVGKRMYGRWRPHRDIWNSSATAGAP